MTCLRAAFDLVMRARSRFLIALVGVAVAVVLMLVQLGLKDAHLRSMVRLHSLLEYDLVLMNVDTTDMVRTHPFSVRRVYQARSVPGVEAVTLVHAARASWRAQPGGAADRSAALPESPVERPSVYAIGIDPDGAAFAAAEMARLRPVLIQPGAVVFDELSQPIYGPVLASLARGDRVAAELNGRSVDVAQTFRLGSSVGIDGAVLMSDRNFRRLFPDRRPGDVDFGLVRAARGVDVEQLARRISHIVPGDVLVLTRQAFMARERAYWTYYTPVGLLLNLGTALGALVAAVLVHQILFAGVTGRPAHERALRAIGARRGFVSRVLMVQAAGVALLGYALGAVFASPIFRLASETTRLPLALELGSLAAVLALTLAVCAAAALWAAQRFPHRLAAAPL